MQDQLLKEANDYLELLRDGQTSDGEEIDRGTILDHYLMTIYELGLKLGSDQSERAKAALSEFVERSSPVLQEFRYRIDEFLQRTGTVSAAFQGSEWIHLLERRSAIQFLIDFSQGTSFEPWAASLNTPALDDALMEIGDREGYLSADKIPDGTPASHWWWWYPNSPPDEPTETSGATRPGSSSA